MPNHDLTLTAQWEFTPNVYTVKYDLNNDSSTEKPRLAMTVILTRRSRERRG